MRDIPEFTELAKKHKLWDYHIEDQFGARFFCAAHRSLSGVDETGHRYYKPENGPASDLAARACNKFTGAHLRSELKASDADSIFAVCRNNLDCAQDFTDLLDRVVSNPESFPLKPLFPVDFSDSISGVCEVQLSADARFQIERARLCKKTHRDGSDLLVGGATKEYCEGHYGTPERRVGSVRGALPPGMPIRAIRCIMDEIEL
jgi:hypothetical protein